MGETKSGGLSKAPKGDLWRSKTLSKWQKRILNYGSGEGTAKSDSVPRHYKVRPFGGAWNVSSPSAHEIKLHGHSS